MCALHKSALYKLCKEFLQTRGKWPLFTLSIQHIQVWQINFQANCYALYNFDFFLKKNKICRKQIKTKLLLTRVFSCLSIFFFLGWFYLLIYSGLSSKFFLAIFICHLKLKGKEIWKLPNLPNGFRFECYSFTSSSGFCVCVFFLM